MANNAAMQGVQSNLSTIIDETRELRAALVATQQQLANLMAGNSAVSTGFKATTSLHTCPAGARAGAKAAAKAAAAHIA